jgi:four helix bundle protein
MMENKNSYHENLKNKIDDFAHEIYRVSKSFPKEEIYGITSQLRRAVVSVALNTIEGYARIKTKVHQNFIEIAFGSLKETLYLIDFVKKEGFIDEKTYIKLKFKGEEIARMLWGILRSIKKD